MQNRIFYKQIDIKPLFFLIKGGNETPYTQNKQYYINSHQCFQKKNEILKIVR